MILLVTNQRDLTTDYVVRELQRRALGFVRLNTEALGEASLMLRPDRPEEDVLECEGQRLRLSDVSRAYFRRPEPPVPPAAIQAPGDRAYCAAEWSSALKSVIGRMHGRWFNDPAAIVRAEDKPRQLQRARSLGLKVPATLITNDPAAARAFAREHACVVKPLRTALVDEADTGKVAFTTRVGPDELEGLDDRIRAAPFILQVEILKRYDVRVTVVQDQVFATAIHSQDHEETQTDWRKGVRPDLRHEVEQLPQALVDECLALTRDLGLGYGAIDLVRDKAGNYWFLEINPNGQWAWIETRTGQPIARAIVDALSEPR